MLVYALGCVGDVGFCSTTVEVYFFLLFPPTTIFFFLLSSFYISSLPLAKRPKGGKRIHGYNRAEHADARVRGSQERLTMQVSSLLSHLRHKEEKRKKKKEKERRLTLPLLI